MENTRKKRIDSLLKELRGSIEIRNPDLSSFERLFDEKKYAHLISRMKSEMGIFCSISVKCIVSSPPVGDKVNIAWVNLPSQFPPYIPQFQKGIKIPLSFYKELLNSYNRFMMAISHELSHVVLHSLSHPLRDSEEATDITAIILGFGKYYELGHTTIKENGYSKLGYLSFDEIMYVIEENENQKKPYDDWFKVDVRKLINKFF